jgi:hypothetical protein
MVHVQTSEQLLLYLYNNGWKPNRQIPDTGKWHFLEIRGLVFWGMVCVVEESIATSDEIKNINSYIKQLLPTFSVGGVDLIIMFSKTPSYTDLLDCLTKSRTIEMQEIIQFTPDRVIAQFKNSGRIFNQNFGGIIHELADNREIVWDLKNDRVAKHSNLKTIVLFLLIFLAFMYFIQQTQNPHQHKTETPNNTSRVK